MPPEGSGPSNGESPATAHGERRAALDAVAAYHQEQLRALLEHVRHGFEQMDRGEIDPFELDELIHRHHRAAQKLWSFSAVGGSRSLLAARAIEWARDEGEECDWWEEVGPRSRG